MAGAKGKSGGARKGAGRKPGGKTKKRIVPKLPDPSDVIDRKEITGAAEDLGQFVDLAAALSDDSNYVTDGDVLVYHKAAIGAALEVIRVGLKMVRAGNVEAVKAFMPLLTKLAPGLSISKIDLRNDDMARSTEERKVRELEDAELFMWLRNYEKKLSCDSERACAEAEA